MPTRSSGPNSLSRIQAPHSYRTSVRPMHRIPVRVPSPHLRKLVDVGFRHLLAPLKDLKKLRADSLGPVASCLELRPRPFNPLALGKQLLDLLCLLTQPSDTNASLNPSWGKGEEVQVSGCGRAFGGR